MTPEEKQKLKYRRQYIICPRKIDCPFNHKMIILDQYYLYYHTDVNVSLYSENNVKIILIGDIFDYQIPKNSNTDIIKDLIDNDFVKVLKKSERYTGRFVLIHAASGKIHCFTSYT